MSGEEERASDEIMGRFFVACQDLLNRGEMTLVAIAEIRNALYGPSVPPIDAHRYDHAALWRLPG